MYSVSVRKNMELDLHQAQSLVADVLKEDYPFVCKEVRTLQHKQDLMAHEAQDLQRLIEIRNAMKVLLTYYLTRNEYTEYFELQRVFGNV